MQRASVLDHVCRVGTYRHGIVHAGVASRHRLLRSAHVEGHGLHRIQHRDGAGHLGRPLDELRGSEHRSDAMQGLRLHAGPLPGSPSGPGSYGHLQLAGHTSHVGVCHRGEMYQLHRGRIVQNQNHDRGRSFVQRCRRHAAGSRLLVRERDHQGLL